MRSWLVCPICGSDKHCTLWIHEPARTIEGRVVKCMKCGAMYKIPSDTSKGVGEYYTEEKHTSGYAALHDGEDQAASELEFKKVLDSLLAELGSRRGRLLDLGCAAGQFMTLAQSAGFDVAGVEINESAAATARERTGAPVFIADLDSSDLPEKGYQAIVMLDLIEHVQDPVALLRRARAALARDGRLVVFTPNHGSLIVKVARSLYGLSWGRFRDPLDRIFDCVHVTFFTVDSLRQAFAAAGLKVQSVDFIRYQPERRNEAHGVAATVLRGLEFISPWMPDGPFRIVMTAVPAPELIPADTGSPQQTAESLAVT